MSMHEKPCLIVIIAQIQRHIYLNLRKGWHNILTPFQSTSGRMFLFIFMVQGHVIYIKSDKWISCHKM